MNSTIAAVALVLCAGLSVAQAPDKRYVLAYSENFAGDQVDTAKWNFRTDSKALSTQLPANVEVRDGKLFITPRRQRVAGMDFTGGGIISKAAFRYGYFQVDAKTVPDPGWHTAFWMMAGDGKTTFNDIMRTEIDDFEIESPDHVSMGYLSWHGKQNLGSKRCNNAYKPGYSTAAAMHTYGVEWTDSTLNYFLDGKMVCTQPYSATAGTHDLVNIWLTTIGARTPIDASGHDPAVFANLRYFVRDYAISAGEPGYAEYGLDWRTGPEPGFSGLPSHVSCSADASAVWTPSILEDGRYSVQVWHVKNSAPIRNADVSATIHHGDGETEKAIPADTPNGWFDLGTYNFKRGVKGTLTLSRAGHTGCVQSNIARFVRQ